MAVKLGEMLLKAGMVTQPQLQEALEAQKKEYEVKHTQKHNAAVDEVTAVVERFNEQVRAYKKKQSG